MSAVGLALMRACSSGDATQDEAANTNGSDRSRIAAAMQSGPILNPIGVIGLGALSIVSA